MAKPKSGRSAQPWKVKNGSFLIRRIRASAPFLDTQVSTSRRADDIRRRSHGALRISSENAPTGECKNDGALHHSPAFRRSATSSARTASRIDCLDIGWSAKSRSTSSARVSIVSTAKSNQLAYPSGGAGISAASGCTFACFSSAAKISESSPSTTNQLAHTSPACRRHNSAASRGVSL